MKGNLLSVIIISTIGLIISVMINTIFPSTYVKVDTVEFQGLIFIAFSLMNYIFFRNEYKIPKGKISNSIKYVLLIGLMWFYGTMGYSSSLNMPVKNDLINALKLLIPILGMGFILGLVNQSSIKSIQLGIRQRRESVFIIGIFALVYFVIRYISYFLDITISMYNEKPIYTLIWTAIMGVHIGIMYISLMKANDIQRAIIECVKFGIVIFGLNWITFSLISYINYNFTFNILEVLLTCSIDIAAVTLACYFAVEFDCNKFKLGKENV